MSAQDTLAKLLVQIREEGGKRTTNVLKGVNKGMKDVSATQERVIRGSGEMSSNSTKNFSKMSQGLSGVVHVYASLAANIFAVSAAFRAMSDAADYERMIRASQQLSIQTGNNFGMVAASLKKISAGAIDMQTAMQTANLGLAAGFSGQQMKKITKLATQAGIALGRSVPDAISRLTTAIVKGEPELTDELGIILRLKEATDDYAKARGKVAKDLTTGERLQAVYQQAIERGTPKYGGIDIEPQVFDKLLSSIKDVSKEFLKIGNSIAKFFIKPLADSKVLIGALFLVLGKLLLTKTTHFFGEGLENRLEGIKGKLSNVTEEAEQAKDKFKVYSQALNDFKAGPETSAKTTAEMIGESFGDLSNVNELPDNLVRAFDKGAEEMGKNFVKSIDKNVLKTLPSTISKALKEGKQAVSFKTKDGGIVELNLESEAEKKLGKDLAKNIQYYNDKNLALKRMNTWYGKLIVRAQSLNAKYTGFETKLKSSALLGIEAGLSKGFMEGTQGQEVYKRNIKDINNQLIKSNLLTRSLAKATFGVSFAMGKAARGLDMIAGLVSKIFGWIAALGIVFGIINKLTGMFTGKLADANSELKEIKTNSETIEKTLNSMNTNPLTLFDKSNNIEKMSNVINQLAENIGKLGSVLDKALSATMVDKIWEKIKFNFNDATEEGVTNLSKMYKKELALMAEASDDGGKKIIKTLRESLDLGNIHVVNVLGNMTEQIDKIQEKLNERITVQGVKFGSPYSAKDVHIMQSYVNLLKEARDAGGEQGIVQQNIFDIIKKNNEKLKEANNLHDLMLAGKQDLLIELLEEVKHYEEITGQTGLIEQIISMIPQKIIESNAELKAMVTTLRDASGVLTTILAKFAKFPGAVALSDSIKAMGEVHTLSKQMSVAVTTGDVDSIKRVRTQLDAAQETVRVLTEKSNIQTTKDINKDNQTLSALKKASESMKDEAGRERAREGAWGKYLDAKLKTLEARGDLANLKSTGADSTMLERAKGALEQAKFTEGKVLQIWEDMATDPLKASKKSGGGGGGKHKPAKFRGNEAQVGLEYLRAIQVVAEANLKSANTSGAVRVDAARTLLDLEYKMHNVRLNTIQANIKDAEENMTKGKDENARSKARLEYAKGLTAEAKLKAEIQDKVIAREEALIDARAQAGQADGGMVLFTIQKTFRDLLNNLEKWTDTFSNAIANVFEATTKSLAEALVTGENNIAESISEALKSSAIDLIDKGFQKVLLEMLPDSFTGIMDPQQFATNNNTAALWANTYAMEMGGAMGPPASLAGMGTGASAAATGGTGIVGTLFNWGASLISKFFADGGIMNHVNAYANGTIARRPELALIGEGSRNEAIVPLPNNRSIPVDLKGQSGNNNSNVSITINSDGSSDVESDNSGEKGAELARVMTIAIKKQLMTEQRPGGLLFTGRR